MCVPIRQDVVFPQKRSFDKLKSAAVSLVLISSLLHLPADTFRVDQTSSTGPGSLPVVLTQASAMPGDHTIEFTVGGTITLTSPLRLITNNLTFKGVADEPVQISGGGTVSIFSFGSGTTNHLDRLHLIHGYAPDGGAAIRNAGTLLISDCVLAQHQASQGSGGAISNSGHLMIVSSTLSTNQAATSGGAIYNSGSVTLSDSKLGGNRAGNGGAIYNEGQAALNQLTLSSNQAVLGFGGAIYSAGQLQASGCTFHHNQATGSQGENSGSEKKCPGGGGAGLGGGVFVAGGSVSLTNCTISGNEARGGAGGNVIGDDLGTGRGGGNNGGSVGEEMIVQTWGQVAKIGGPGGPGGFGGGGGGGGGESNYKGQGGLGGFGGGGGGGGGYGTYLGPIREPHNTGGIGQGGFGGGKGGIGYHSYNSGGGGGGAGIGGGLFVKSGHLALLNCTIVSNTASGGAGGAAMGITGSAGQSGQGIGGGIYNFEGTVGLTNTIVAGNTGHSPDVAGHYLSSGFNLIGNSEGAEGLHLMDIQNEPAHLGPLEDNGGSTLTHALLQGSLAIGRGDGTAAPATDQRGISRLSGPVDIGAYQLVPRLTPTIDWPQPAEIIYGALLSSVQLNATTDVEGTLHYTPPEETLLPAGTNQVLAVTFIPADQVLYNTATHSVTIDVLKANQIITFEAIANLQTNALPIPLKAVASSGLPVTLSVVSGPAAVEDNVLRPGSQTGLVTVRATQPGNTNYHAAPDVEQSFFVGPLPWPAIALPPASQTVKPGEGVKFHVEAFNGPLAYQWRRAGEAIPGQTSSDLVLARVRPSQAGSYDVIVRNTSGSVTSAVATLTVTIPEGSPLIISQPRNLTLKAGEMASFSVIANGPLPLHYQWYQGTSGDTNGWIPGATNATYSTTTVATNTSFWVSVRNEIGIIDSEAAAVVVFPVNAARLKLQMMGGQPGLTISGVPGTAYRIEYRSSLPGTGWVKLLDLILPADPFTFFDPEASGTSSRFYRAVGP